MKTLIKLENNPNVLIVNHIYEYDEACNIYIPIIQKSSFKINDYVYKNTFFGPFIASVSGYISGSKKIFLNKKYIPSLKITNDYKENMAVKPRKKKVTNKEELLNTLDKYCLYQIKKKIVDIENIDNLVISSIDEEVYSLKELMILANYYDEILETITFLQNILKVKKGIIATKNTDSLSIKKVKSIIGTYLNLKMILVPDKYLIGYKENLCPYLNLKEENTLILKTSEIYDIYLSIIKGKFITETIITISGDALEKSLVIKTRLGVPLKELIKKYFKITTKEYDVYINGYLQGIKIKSIDDIVITKEIDSIIINKRKEESALECINCGACLKVCPHNINIKYCLDNHLSSKKCIGCGLCNYVCPARIKLKEIVMSDNNEN